MSSDRRSLPAYSVLAKKLMQSSCSEPDGLANIQRHNQTCKDKRLSQPGTHFICPGCLLPHRVLNSACEDSRPKCACGHQIFVDHWRAGIKVMDEHVKQYSALKRHHDRLSRDYFKYLHSRNSPDMPVLARMRALVNAVADRNAIIKEAELQPWFETLGCFFLQQFHRNALISQWCRHFPHRIPDNILWRLPEERATPAAQPISRGTKRRIVGKTPRAMTGFRRPAWKRSAPNDSVWRNYWSNDAYNQMQAALMAEKSRVSSVPPKKRFKELQEQKPAPIDLD